MGQAGAHCGGGAEGLGRLRDWLLNDCRGESHLRAARLGGADPWSGAAHTSGLFGHSGSTRRLSERVQGTRAGEGAWRGRPPHIKADTCWWRLTT
jgi:hypothetical protein